MTIDSYNALVEYLKPQTNDDAATRTRNAEIWCGANKAEYHPIGCALAQQEPCTHLNPKDADAAIKAFSALYPPDAVLVAIEPEAPAEKGKASAK